MVQTKAPAGPYLQIEQTNTVYYCKRINWLLLGGYQIIIYSHIVLQYLL